MKTKVTIPVLLTVELNEPDARAGAALLRELLGTKRHHTTVQVLHAKIESCCATLHGEVSLPMTIADFNREVERLRARQKRKPAKSKRAK